MQRRLFTHLVYTVALLLSLLLVLSVSVAQQDEAQSVFRIGVLDTARGPITQGAQLAVRQINEAGGVEGADGTLFRLELVIEPTAEGDDLEEAILDIDQARVIAVLGPVTTEQVLNNLPLLQDLDVPVLTPAIGDTIIASDTSERILRTRAAERLLGSGLANYIINELNADEVVTVQLDRLSTAGRVGFSIALEELNGVDEDTILLEAEDDLIDITQSIAQENPPVVVAYGPPAVASNLYTQLRDIGWVGTFAYPQALEETFLQTVPLDLLGGVITTTTWPLAAVDEESVDFLTAFVRTFGEVPGPIEASAYDAVNLIASAIGSPGPLLDNLRNTRNTEGVQGTLNPTGLRRGELSDTVAVIQLNAVGGPDVVARYQATERLEPEAPDVVIGEPTLTPTPEGVSITIESARQNVRTGPGLNYDVLGQLVQGEQAQVIGATTDFSWVAIQYRGQTGWLATYLLDVFGDRATVPVLTPPPTPTPLPATATPTPEPFADVIVVSASPSNITAGVPTSVNVTVRNAGAQPAGPFAVAATFPPSSTYAAANVSALAAGAETTVQLPMTLTGATGNYSVVIVADLNDQVQEGPQGEANNDDFVFNYRLDRQLILINSATLPTGTPIDLEGNVTPIPDLQYTGAGLNTVADCTGTANCIGLLSPTLSFDTATYDAVTSANGINSTFIPNANLTPGATIGVLTAEGRRGVLRVDSINPGSSITLTYRIYQ
jgi:ABC-type branched-subunit amino acid transport system substrate-binding protein